MLYTDSKNFPNRQDRVELTSKLPNIVFQSNNTILDEFLSICRNKLEDDVPCKQKYTRGNHMLFMNLERYNEKNQAMKTILKK